MKIPQELDYLLKKQKRKDSKQRILRVYEALIYKKEDKKDYFSVPSSYLTKINSRYYLAIDALLEHKIIKFYSKDKDYVWDNLFENRKYEKRYYNTSNGICMKYKFLIDINSGYDYEFDYDFSSMYEDEKWYSRTRYSLLKLGFSIDEIRIKRDNFSRRLHTNITGSIPGSESYRNLLSGGEYYSIDSKNSQPRLLWMELNRIGLYDTNYNYIFENKLDFYDYIIEKIPVLSSREEAKELFASWINGNGYVDIEKTSIRNIFPVVNTYLRNYKQDGYKSVCRNLQTKESNIFIDYLLNNVPVDFCLSVHDSLIVKKEDVQIVMSFCNESFPELIFVAEEIKRKP